MHFGENQLSPSLIGLSPLPTGHPPGFQPWWVRSSTRSYPRFNLPMARSLGFATASIHLTLPDTSNSPVRYAKSTRSQAQGPLPPLVGARFQVLFHSPPGVLFTFPSRYLSAIGHQGVFRLSGWSRQIHTEFLGLRATWDNSPESQTFRLQGCYLLCLPIRMAFTYECDFLLRVRSADLTERSHNPGYATPAGYHAYSVWPLPRSLATTYGITVVFSSCGY